MTDSLQVAMRRWASGVTIVTAQHNGQRHGMTVSSFTSVSLQPSIVLICIDRSNRTHDLVLESGRFAICFLRHDQRELSDRFAGRIPGIKDRFEGIELETTASGLSFPAGCLATLDCSVVASHMPGQSSVFMAEVRSVTLGPEGQPLLYFNQDYRSLEE